MLFTFVKKAQDGMTSGFQCPSIAPTLTFVCITVLITLFRELVNASQGLLRPYGRTDRCQMNHSLLINDCSTFEICYIVVHIEAEHCKYVLSIVIWVSYVMPWKVKTIVKGDVNLLASKRNLCQDYFDHHINV